jgi:uncharacterized protein (DUF1697 family)
MNKYVALLRGINVGGNSKIDMKALKVVFEQTGFTHVKTYINSGNVLFMSNDPSTRSIKSNLEESIRHHLGLTIEVMVREEASIAQLCLIFPKEWTNDDDQKTDILFLSDHYDKPDTLSLIKHDPSVDHLISAPGAIGWNILRSNSKQSGMKKFIGSPVYKNMTARNINTVRKLNELFKELGE